MNKYAYRDIDELCRELGCSADGLTLAQVHEMRRRYGANEFKSGRHSTILRSIRRAFVNPFNIILFVLAIISTVTDIFSTSGFSRNISTSFIIFSMIVVSAVIRLIQELRANNAAEQLDKMIRDYISVKRDGEWMTIPASELVVGDLISFSAGDRIPADTRITKVNNLFTSQAALTGESNIIENTSEVLESGANDLISGCTNLVFMATTVISGNGQGIVFAVGSNTEYGGILDSQQDKKDSFQSGANSIAWVLLKFMTVLIPIIFVLLGITGGKWFESFAFALSVSVGLVPELLPMVITACLAKGSLTMSKKDTIVKNINAMQSFGSMDVLCMDKTGTLTNESIILEYYMDILGNESGSVLDMAFLNSSYHTGICNPIDNAVAAYRSMPGRESHFASLIDEHAKLDEIPFTHSRKHVSVLVSGDDGNIMITKGDIANVVDCCTSVEFRGEVLPITDDSEGSISAIVDEMLEDGMKVIAIAKKDMGSKEDINISDECDMTLMGYLAFFDAPKSTAKESISQLKNLCVRPKLLTGDLVPTARSVCRRVGIPFERIVTGAELNRMTDVELTSVAEQVDVFAELTPIQKVRVVSALRDNGHSVGFLGDGINDIPVLNEADVGISVDTAVDAAKEGADVVLLYKDLTVLTEGILEGRRIFANMMKYIKITASSNFGNIFSIVCASAFLPFLPMASIQILLLNLLYDTLCIVLPWDNVDVEEILHPKKWSGRNLTNFMLSFGPISSLFDVLTFLFLYFILCPMATGGMHYSELTSAGMQLTYIALFQTGWFLESMWTQVLILHFLRTSKLPFIQSKPSAAVMIITLAGVIAFTGITFTGAATVFGLVRMPAWYFIFLIVTSIVYMLLATVVKHFYQRKHHELI